RRAKEREVCVAAYEDEDRVVRERVRLSSRVLYKHARLFDALDLGEEEETEASLLYLALKGLANPVLDAALFGIAVLPVRRPDGEGRSRAALGEEERGLGGGVAATDDEHVLSHVWEGLDEALVYFREFFAGDA